MLFGKDHLPLNRVKCGLPYFKIIYGKLKMISRKVYRIQNCNDVLVFDTKWETRTKTSIIFHSIAQILFVYFKGMTVATHRISTATGEFREH